jgi:hypothetical protein
MHTTLIGNLNDADKAETAELAGVVEGVFGASGAR